MSTILGLTPGLSKPRRTTFPNSISNLLGDAFFRLLLLDPYLKDVGGSNPQLVAKQFLDQLDTYNILGNKPNKKMYYDTYEVASNADGIRIAQDPLGDIELLLSGYIPIYGTGHAVCLLIEKKGDDRYSLSIINSGEGLDYHKKGDLHDEKKNIIIRFNDLSAKVIQDIKYIHSFISPKRAMKGDRDKCFREMKNADSRRLWRHNSDDDGRHAASDGYWLGKPLRRELFPDRMVKMEEFNIHTFYDSIFGILDGEDEDEGKDASFEVVYKNYPQFSSSCAVFSQYHFIAYYIFDNNEAEFQTFMNQVYVYLIDNFINKIFLPMETAIDGLSTIVNITHILLKDYPLSDKLREQIEYKLQEIYSNFENTAIGYRDVKGINDFDAVKKAYNMFMMSTKGIYDLYTVLKILATISLNEPDKNMCNDLIKLKCAYVYYKTAENTYKSKSKLSPIEMRKTQAFSYLTKIIGGSVDGHRSNTPFFTTNLLYALVIGGFLLMFDDTNIVPKFAVHRNFGYAIHQFMCCQYISIGNRKWPGCSIPIQFNLKYVTDLMVKFASFLYDEEPHGLGGKDAFFINDNVHFGQIPVDYLNTLDLKLKEEPVIDAEYQKLSLFVNSINNKDADVKVESFYTTVRGIFSSFTEPMYYGNTQGIDACTHLYTYNNQYFNNSGVLPQIKKGLFIDAIENALEQLDKEIFLETIHTINGDMVETILFFLYIFDRDFVIANKELFVDALEPESPMRAIITDDLYTEYSKIFSHEGMKGTGILEALFITVFVDADYEADKRFIENISRPNKNVLGDAYELVVGKEINSQFDNYTVYRKKDTPNEYECVHPQGKRFTLLIDKDPVYRFNTIIKRKFNTIEYNFKVQSEFTDIKLGLIIKKLDLSKESYKIWQTYLEKNIIIDLDDHINSRIEIPAKGDATFIDKNGISYKIIMDYSALNGIWAFNMTNCFLLSNNNKFYMLALLNNAFVMPKLSHKDFYWYDYSLEVRRGGSFDAYKCLSTADHQQYVMEIHYTGLSVLTTTYEETAGLFLSLHLANNLHGLDLMFPTIRNTPLNAPPNTIYNFETILTKMDLPLWPIYQDLRIHDNFGWDYEASRRKQYFKRTVVDSRGRFIVEPTQKFSLIQDLSDELYTHRKNLLEEAERNTDVIDSLTKTYKVFLGKFRHICQPDMCGEDKALVNKIVETAFNKKNITDMSNLIFNSMLYKNREFQDISTLYEQFFEFFYHRAIDNLFALAFAEFELLIKEDCDLINCGRILKAIELLDERNIYPLNQQREIQDVLFEIHKGLFLRCDQKNTLEDIYRTCVAQSRLEAEEQKKKAAEQLAAEQLAAEQLAAEQLAAEQNRLEAQERREERYRLKKELARAKDPLNGLFGGGGCDVAESPQKSGKTAYEILMGRGKTSTLTPMLLLYSHLRTKNKFYNVVLPSTLVQQSYKIIFELSNLLYNIKIFKSTIDGYRILYDNVIHILSDSSLKIITLNALTKPVFYRLDSFFIFDEIDTLLNPLKSYLNRPFSVPLLHPNMTTLVGLLCDFLLNSTDIKNLDQYIDKWSKDPAFKKVLSTKLYTTMSQAYVMKHNQTYGFGTNSATGIIIFDTLMANASYFKAIPYSANKTPVEGSEFSDFELALVLTILTYKQTKLRKEDIVLLLEVIKEDLGPIKQFSEDITIAAITQKYKSLVKVITPQELLRIVNSIKLDKMYIEECEKLADSINKLESTFKDVLLFYLNKVIFAKLFKIHSDQQNISTVDLFDPSICTSHVSFSGTVNFHMPAELIRDSVSVADVPDEYTEGQITNIVSDEAVGAAIEAAFYGRTVGRKPEIVNYKPSPEAEQELINYVSTNISKYNSLIDCAGLILNHSPEEIITIFSAAAPDRIFIYIDNKDEKKVREKGVTSKYNDKIINNVFIYYDHKHCVGADVKQPNKMHGLVTLSDENTLTEASQAIFRLRNINVGHSIDFFCSLATSPDQENKYRQLAKLYVELKERDRRFKDNTKEDAQLQCIKYLYRHLKKDNPLMYKGAFNESLFYDTKPIDGQYLTYDEFLQTQIKTYKQTIPLNDFTINKRNLAAIQVEVVQQEEIVQQTVTKVETKFNQLANLTRKILQRVSVPVTAYCNVISSLADPSVPINSLDGFTYGQLLHLPSANWTLYLSPELYYSLVGYMYIELTALETPKHPNKNNGVSGTEAYYMLHNTNVPNCSLLITYSEYIVLSTCKACPSTVSVYDAYGKCILGNRIIFHPFIELLCFKKNLSVIDTFTILTNSSYGDIRKFKYYQYILKRNYTFNVEMELDQKLNSANARHWSLLYNLPIDETDFIQKLVQDYSEHTDTEVDTFYKTQPSITLPSFEEDIAAELERQATAALERQKLAAVINDDTDNNERYTNDDTDNNERVPPPRVRAAAAGGALRRVSSTYKIATNGASRKTRKRRLYKSFISHIRSTGVKGIGVRTRPNESRLHKKHSKMSTRRGPRNK